MTNGSEEDFDSDLRFLWRVDPDLFDDERLPRTPSHGGYKKTKTKQLRRRERERDGGGRGGCLLPLQMMTLPAVSPEQPLIGETASICLFLLGNESGRLFHLSHLSI